MPHPETTAIPRNDLGAVAWEYAEDATNRGFIGLRVMPSFNVIKKEGKYPVITIESLLRTQSTKRATRGKYQRSDYTFDEKNYACSEYGFEELLDDSESIEYSQILFPAEVIAVKRATDAVLMQQEIRTVAKLLNTSALENDAVTTAWSDQAGATPRKDVLDATDAMRSGFGTKPNKMVVSNKTKNDLLLTKELTDALKYTNPIELGGAEAQLRVLAQYFGVDEFLVADAQKDTSKKGKGFVLGDIWTNTICGLYSVDASLDLRKPTIGRSFLWTADSAENLVTEQYRDETTRSQVYRVRQTVAEEYIFTGAGYLLTGV